MSATTSQRLVEFSRYARIKKIPAKNLSGGTKKRLDIGCALVNNPEILILDEPFLGLDPERINKLLKVLIYLNKNKTTLIISSHIVSELTKICNKIGLIKNKQFKFISKEEITKVYKRW